MADPENPKNPHQSGASPNPQDPENPTDDAILRNLAELMGQEEVKNKPFKSQQDPLKDAENETSTKSEIQPVASPEIPDPQQSTIPKAAAEAARMRRQNRNNNPPSTAEDGLPEEELDVIFEEDNSQSDQSDVQLNEDPHPSDATDNSPEIPTSTNPDGPGKRNPLTGSLTPVELTSITILSVALIAAAVMLTLSIATALNEFQQPNHPSRHAPPDSLTGEFIQLSGITCFWRDRNENDRAQETSSILPVINIKSGTGNGMLQVLFHDELGKVRGDSHIHRIKPSGTNPPTVNTPITMLGTEGLLNEIEYIDYSNEENPMKNDYWTITFNESADEENWMLIGKFRIPADRL